MVRSGLALVCALLALAAPSCRSTDRTLTLRIGADEAFRAKPDWQKTIRRRVAAVSQVYEQTFAIRWKVAETFAWQPFGRDMDEQRGELKRSHRYARGRIVLGISTRTDHNRLGSVVSFSDTGVVANFPNWTEEANTATLAHELAHFFGAPHSGDSQSALNPRPSALRFDGESAGIIRRMRFFDFGHGLEQPDATSSAELIAFLSSSSSSSSPASDARLKWGLLLRADDEPELAVKQFRRAVELSPANANARFLLGAALNDIGKKDEAIGEYSEAVKLQPDYADAHEQLGILLAGKGEIGRGTAALRRALALEPRDAQKAANLAIILLRQPGHLHATASLLERVLEQRPDWVEMRRHLESARTAERQLSGAVLAYRAALSRNPGHIEALAGLGASLVAQGNFSEAVGVLRTASRADPHNAAVRSNLAAALYGLGRYDEARGELEQSRKMHLPVAPEVERVVGGR